MATHSSTLAWKIPWTEEPVGCSPWGLKESNATERLQFQFSLSCTGEGNGNPLQCSCLENPRNGGAWWAVVYGVTQSWTRLKRLSSSSSSSNSPSQLPCLPSMHTYRKGRSGNLATWLEPLSSHLWRCCSSLSLDNSKNLASVTPWAHSWWT